MPTCTLPNTLSTVVAAGTQKAGAEGWGRGGRAATGPWGGALPGEPAQRHGVGGAHPGNAPGQTAAPPGRDVPATKPLSPPSRPLPRLRDANEFPTVALSATSSTPPGVTDSLLPVELALLKVTVEPAAAVSELLLLTVTLAALKSAELRMGIADSSMV